MNLRWISIGAAAAALLGGLWIWAAARAPLPVSPTEPISAAPAESLTASVAALRAELAAERDARLGLEAEVEMLRLLLDDFAGGAQLARAARATAPTAEDPATAMQSWPQQLPANAAEVRWFDQPALLALGVSAQESARLQGLFEESELQLLYLRDQATREGWAGTPRFLTSVHELRSGLRERAGDETFDWLLYAGQRPNRVAVREVLSTGPAAQSGLQAGDLILRYDDRAIFKGRELQGATTQGEAGRSIFMDVQSKDGQVRRLTVPSGPLGIHFAEERHPPQSIR